MLALVLCLALHADPEPAPAAAPAPATTPAPEFVPVTLHPVTTPWYLPRYAYAGVFLAANIVAPSVRVGWEAAFFEDGRNLLQVYFELGPAFAVAHQSYVSLFWEHAAVAGLSYRWGKARGFQWGFQIGAGAMLEGATYNDGRSIPREERVIGFVDGRAYGGARVGPLILALAVGYGSTWNGSNAFPTTLDVGGFTLGVIVNWR